MHICNQLRVIPLRCLVSSRLVWSGIVLVVPVCLLRRGVAESNSLAWSTSAWGHSREQDEVKSKHFGNVLQTNTGQTMETKGEMGQHRPT